jgi:glyceraldehyde-3-phosphate dehydrogenase (NADP+)
MSAAMTENGKNTQMLIGGKWVSRTEMIAVRNSYGNELIGQVPRGTVADVKSAIDASAQALTQDFPLHARYEVLMKTAALVDDRSEEYARTIAGEGSKTIREARREPVRAANILRLAAEEGRRLTGETLPFDSRAGSENRVGYFFRFPVGIVCAIIPFNDPLALAAHNIGPAVAAGNSIVLKPSILTPLSVLMLADDLMRAGLPEGRLSVITGHGRELGESLVSDPRVRLVSFTGGVEAGVQISRWVGIKKVLMELGSNSPVIVMDDANLERAVPAISSGAFAQAGENCIGVQRILVHEKIYEDFKNRFVSYVSKLKTGYSMDESMDVCAMITETEAQRVETWVKEAEAKGARILAGGRREGSVVWPTVLEHVPPEAKIDCEEVYGPVVTLYKVGSLEKAVTLANQTTYGLHAAIFTEKIDIAFRAVRDLHCGGVIVNDSTDYRLDVMPFGGTKLSGIGRMGIWSMLQEMTETRVVCLNL